MANVILITPSPKYATGINRATITPPLGLAYLAGVLEKNKHKVQIIDANILNIEPGRLADSFAFKPDLIGISSNIVTFRGALECAEQLKASYPNIPVIFGGPYCSSLPEDILKKTPSVDAVVTGEGENTLAEIVGSLDRKNVFEDIKGVVYKHGSQIINNAPRPLIKDLDDIPLPAYHLLPDLRVYRTRGRAQPVGFIFTSRGCPARCTFCNRNIFGIAWRPHSSDRVIDEIDYLVKRYGIRQLDILDDNFTFNFDRAGQILERLSRKPFKLYLNLQNGIRIDRVNEELLHKMREAGVFKLGLGVETASQHIQRRVKKRVDLEKAVTITKTARSLGIITYGFFMVGLPGDNAETMKETIEFAIRMNPHFVNISMCTPFPGTELYEEIKKKGHFLEDVENGIGAGFFEGKVFYKLDSMNPKEIASYFKMAYKRFYMRPSKVIDILRTLKSFEEIKWLFKAAKEIL